ncbi:DNA repair protein Rad26 [Aspergillus ellipticus CBS 707.79]|uniref:DNA repair protein Rad26 n=1 Tax=Aspergillus ellipticus CBS 707.79 TaxID=1448320 RepID=A0A319D004_9EURO|nr:DNA repair protein Rad26 [Aspergillus ellipticus CBS 707.79]
MEDLDEDFFSDDGFDDLPPGTLFQLEQNAFNATQAQKKPTQQQPVANAGGPTHTLANQAPPTEISKNAIASNSTLQPPPPHLHSGLTDDYDNWDIGELDAEVLDNGVPIRANALEQAAALTATSQLPGHETFADNDQSGDFADAMDMDSMDIEDDGASRFPEIHKAYAELSEKLALENARHQQMAEQLSAAQTKAESKAGEIAIIRANQAKAAENYDRQLATLRKTMADEAARHAAEVEAAREEGKRFATENAFLKHDLAEESIRTNQWKGKGRADEKPPPVTPRKARVLPFRDGFDDDEILAVSPTKSARGKRFTPVVPGKRKRQLSQDSQIPLQLSPQAEPMPVEEPSDDVMADDAADDDASGQEQPEPEEPVPGFVDTSNVKDLMNHMTYPNEKPDIEVMAELTFPSEPQRSVSTLLLEETSNLDFGNYMVEYARAIVSLWSRALTEKYYQPIPMFISLMRLLLRQEVQAADSGLAELLVPVLKRSGDVNGNPRFRYSPVSQQSFGQVRKTPLSELQPLVDSTEVLQVLFDMVSQRLHVEEEMNDFWRLMDYEYVLMLLNCSQPIEDIILILNILSTSIRADSFGSIQPSEQAQTANENYIVDRVTHLLSENPQVDEGQPAYLPIEICSMRQEALGFLANLAYNTHVPDSTHGSLVIASHPTVLGRLIRVMHDELTALYTFPPERDLHAGMVNRLMSLVHALMKRHPEQAELQPKLSRVAAGKQKFLAVMTRLAFSEGIVLEAGISDETVEMAHEILDDAVTPEEAEYLLEAFPNARQEE